jgi:hypothetical protein
MMNSGAVMPMAEDRAQDRLDVLAARRGKPRDLDAAAREHGDHALAACQIPPAPFSPYVKVLPETSSRSSHALSWLESWSCTSARRRDVGCHELLKIAILAACAGASMPLGSAARR